MLESVGFSISLSRSTNQKRDAPGERVPIGREIDKVELHARGGREGDRVLFLARGWREGKRRATESERREKENKRGGRELR